MTKTANNVRYNQRIIYIVFSHCLK